MKSEMKETRALRMVLSVPWAISEPELWKIIEIASRSNLDLTAAFEIAEKRRQMRMAALDGESLKGTRSVMVNSDGVAIVPVFDSLFRRAGLFDAISGAMSMEMIERDFEVALRSNNVKAIALDMDSPGGEVNFTEELSDTIYNARGIKPIKAFVSGSATSAAFWIASSADEIVVTNTGFLGSVGVVATFIDRKELNKKIGIEEIEIVSSVSPDKRPDPSTAEGKKKIQALVDSLGNVFVTHMARNLDLSEDQIKSWKGGVLIGEQAVEAGMASRVAYRRDVMSELAGGKSAKSSAPVTADLAPSPVSISVDDKPIPQDSRHAEAEESLLDPQLSATIQSDSEGGKEMSDKKEARGALATIAAALGLGPEETTAPATGANAKPEKSEREKALEGKAAENFVALQRGRVVPAAHGQLKELYVSAQELGIEDKVEAFVNALPAHNLTADVIPPREGSGYATAIDPIEVDDAEIERTKAHAREYISSHAEDDSPVVE